MVDLLSGRWSVFGLVGGLVGAFMGGGRWSVINVVGGRCFAFLLVGGRWFCTTSRGSQNINQ